MSKQIEVRVRRLGDDYDWQSRPVVATAQLDTSNPVVLATTLLTVAGEVEQDGGPRVATVRWNYAGSHQGHYRETFGLERQVAELA